MGLLSEIAPIGSISVSDCVTGERNAAALLLRCYLQAPAAEACIKPLPAVE